MGTERKEIAQWAFLARGQTVGWQHGAWGMEHGGAWSMEHGARGMWNAARGDMEHGAWGMAHGAW